MDEFNNQVVLVTGAGRGLGGALAETFAAAGARVAVNDLTPVNLIATVDRISAAGGRVRAYETDVTKKMPVQTLVNRILDDWGRVDILVNNAQVNPQIPILDMDEWDWHRTLDVNLTGPFLLTQTTGRVMRTIGGGVILHLALLSPRAYDLTYQAAYLAGKIGLMGFTRAVAQELQAYQIRVNMICSRHLSTQFTADRQPDPEILGVRKWLSNIPPGTLSPPASVTGLALFLSSSTASPLTGQALFVDEGPATG